MLYIFCVHVYSNIHHKYSTVIVLNTSTQQQKSERKMGKRWKKFPFFCYFRFSDPKWFHSVVRSSVWTMAKKNEGRRKTFSLFFLFDVLYFFLLFLFRSFPSIYDALISLPCSGIHNFLTYESILLKFNFHKGIIIHIDFQFHCSFSFGIWELLALDVFINICIHVYIFFLYELVPLIIP